MQTEPPSTQEEILAAATIDPAIAEALGQNPAASATPDDLLSLKEIVQASLPELQKQLASTRPSNVTETERTIPLSDEIHSRVIICHPTIIDVPSPVIVLYHGGGNCFAYPETELELARQLAINHSATVLCPSFRLAPQHPFPAALDDAWAFLQYLSEEMKSLHNVSQPLLPKQADPKAGFIIGGSSSGAYIAAVLAHLARDNRLSPPLTGQFLVAGDYIDHEHVPEKYQKFYLSYEQCKDAPILNRKFLQIVRDVCKPDPTSPMWAPFDQYHPSDGPGEVKNGHMGLAPAYFQVCGMDPLRDDGLIYEKVLREECGVPTKLALYRGYPHVWWAVFPGLEMSKQRFKDSVDAIGWLSQICF
ncbi:alpha/beta-hydrolase [Rhizodiscina lignyota]|uniref:Alpha/beta-hydrolase n=1 Tax=Rhizodiscina lignyota TaxID=1504668 RepID=A0A9P4IH13_9PEZI|nr:alpha/beta-hydrolase [Rhizodiscina lignyota]